MPPTMDAERKRTNAHTHTQTAHKHRPQHLLDSKALARTDAGGDVGFGGCGGILCWLARLRRTASQYVCSHHGWSRLKMCSQFINEPSPGPATAVRRNQHQWQRTHQRLATSDGGDGGDDDDDDMACCDTSRFIFVRWHRAKHATGVRKNGILTLHVTVFGIWYVARGNMLCGTPPMVFRAPTTANATCKAIVVRGRCCGHVWAHNTGFECLYACV